MSTPGERIAAEMASSTRRSKCGRRRVRSTISCMSPPLAVPMKCQRCASLETALRVRNQIIDALMEREGAEGFESWLHDLVRAALAGEPAEPCSECGGSREILLSGFDGVETTGEEYVPCPKCSGGEKI